MQEGGSFQEDMMQNCKSCGKTFEIRVQASAFYITLGGKVPTKIDQKAWAEFCPFCGERLQEPALAPGED